VADQNRELVRRYFEEMLNGRDLPLLEELLSPDCVFTAPPVPSGLHGTASIRPAITSLFDTFPDLAFTVHEQIVEGDVAAVRWTMRGTHEGEWLGIPASGTRVVLTGINVFHFAGGRIRRVHAEGDYLGALQQISGKGAQGGG
jgi:steroid delta-isomerase-like uncharacterized protein